MRTTNAIFLLAALLAALVLVHVEHDPTGIDDGDLRLPAREGRNARSG